MRPLIFVLVLLLAPATVGAVTLDGPVEQGALVIGHAAPGATVSMPLSWDEVHDALMEEGLSRYRHIWLRLARR